jgi:hypothetical protein
MNFNNKLIVLIISIVTVTFLAAACGNPTEGKTEKAINITFSFAHQVDGSSIILDTIIYENAVGNKYSLMTIRYFISELELHTEQNDQVDIIENHYVDMDDERTLLFKSDKELPKGKYTSLSFVFGLDTLSNATGRFPNPPKSKMEWPVGMGGGYHYMKLEGRFLTDGLISSFQAHSGELGGVPYCILVELPLPSLELSEEDVSLEIIMNIDNWWQNPHMLDLNDVTGIMGDTLMQQKLMENGRDVFSLGEIKKLQ